MDVEKSNIENKKSSKRIRRRKRMMNVYTLAVIMLVIVAAVTACLTVMFNIKHIIISGESDNYTYMEVVDASGIRVGDNLIRVNTSEVEKQILDKLIYVETVEIEKKFPVTIKINVTKCIPCFNVEYGEGVLLVSRSGKILSDNQYYVNDLPIIHGFVPSDLTLGTTALSENLHLNDAFLQLTERFSKGNDENITYIDMTNDQQITVTYKNGIVFKMGNWTDIDYKLTLAQTVMQDSSVQDKSGYITMIGNNQCSFRANAEPVTEVVTEFPQEITDSTEPDNIQVDWENYQENDNNQDDWQDYQQPDYSQDDWEDYQENDNNQDDWQDYQQSDYNQDDWQYYQEPDYNQNDWDDYGNDWEQW